MVEVGDEASDGATSSQYQGHETGSHDDVFCMANAH